MIPWHSLSSYLCLFFCIFVSRCFSFSEAAQKFCHCVVSVVVINNFL